jgi:RimJ/RimL family protein N-acetyltransferase
MNGRLIPRSHAPGSGDRQVGTTRLRVRSITRGEAKLFASLSADPKRTEELLIQVWDECQSCPEWCFVVERNGIPIGRIGFWALPSLAGTYHFSWFELPWRGDYRTVGHRLISESVKRMRDYGASSLETAVDSDQGFTSRRRQFLESVGMTLLQEKIEFGLQPENCKAGRNRLTYQNLCEVGKDAVIDALAQVTVDTLDRDDSFSLKRSGSKDTAQREFGILHDIDPTPERMQLAYGSDRGLVGLVAPQMLSEETGAINYTGVVPARRGQGYVDDLLRRGIAVLSQAKARLVVADVDTLNTSMTAALLRAGFNKRSRMWIYRKEISRQTRRRRDAETRRTGDAEKMRHGDAETHSAMSDE